MRFTVENMKRLIKYRNGMIRLTVDELNRLELDEEYDNLNSLYKKSELIYSTIDMRETWSNDNFGRLNDINDKIKTSKGKIYNILLDIRLDKINNIIDENN